MSAAQAAHTDVQPISMVLVEPNPFRALVQFLVNGAQPVIQHLPTVGSAHRHYSRWDMNADE